LDIREAARKKELERVEAEHRIQTEKHEQQELIELENKRLLDEQTRLEFQSAEHTIREEEHRRARIRQEEQLILNTKLRIEKQQQLVAEMEDVRRIEKLALQTCILDNVELEARQQQTFVKQELVRVVENKRLVKLESDRVQNNIENYKEMERMRKEEEELNGLGAILDNENQTTLSKSHPGQ
jgi:hypothetical protein